MPLRFLRVLDTTSIFPSGIIITAQCVSPASWNQTKRGYLSRSAWISSSFFAAIFVFVIPFCLANPATAQDKGIDIQNQRPLDIVDPIESEGELQRELILLQKESDEIDSLAKAKGSQIYDQLGHLPHSSKLAIEAATGAVLWNSKDIQGIDKKIETTADDMASAQSAFKQAEEALQGGQKEQFLKKTAEGLELLRESKESYSDAVSDTIKILERSGKVLAPESWDRKLAVEIAQRLWEARSELTKPLQDLAKIGDTSEDQENLLKIKYGLNQEIAAMHAQLQQLQEQPLRSNKKPAVDAANLNPAKSSKVPVPVHPGSTEPVTVTSQKLTPQEKAAGSAKSTPPAASQPNSAKAPLSPSSQGNPLVTGGTLTPPTANNSKPDNPTSTSTGVTFDPSTMTPQEKAAWQKNQAIIAGETLHPTVPPSAPPTGAATSIGFDPSTLSAAERAAWERNQANVAKETLGTTDQTGDPLAEALNQNMKGEMGAGNPYTKDQMIPTSTAGSSSGPGNPTSTPSTSVTFDPSRMTPQEKAAWQRNQAIVAQETLHPTFPSGDGSGNGSSTDGFDPSTLSPSERAAWERNQASMGKEVLGRQVKPGTRSTRL